LILIGNKYETGMTEKQKEIIHEEEKEKIYMQE
jgi:hypothetical protein